MPAQFAERVGFEAPLVCEQSCGALIYKPTMSYRIRWQRGTSQGHGRAQCRWHLGCDHPGVLAGAPSQHAENALIVGP